MKLEGERLALALQLWAEGLGASQIADRVGNTTRNSVIAKMDRLRRKGGPDAPVARPNGFSRPQAHQAQKNRTRAKAKSAPPYVEKPVRVFDRSKMVGFAELEDGHCRFPIGDPRQSDFKYCGEKPVRGLPYCSECATVAYAPPKIAVAGVKLPAGGYVVVSGSIPVSGTSSAAGEAPEREMEEA